MSFWGELRRRNVVRVGAAYAIVAWLLIQIASATFPQLQLPVWAPTLVTVLLLLGFPVALLLAWAFDLTPEGIKLSQNDNSNARAAGGRNLDYGLIAGLVIVATLTVWGQLSSVSVNERTQPTEVGQVQSIAVLPFADMSPGGDQEYFGDGIAEELLNELTPLEGLRVAGRTSSFSFKQSDEDLPTIGEALGVTSILEGSIRKDGSRIRITAQLISTADGYHIWSETYDRELTDIFAIQEEIAASVAGALGVRLGVGGVNAFRGAGTRNVEAYEAYLRGSLAPVPEKIRLFERATQLDPNYAAAWASLGLVTGASMWNGLPEDAPETLELAYPLVQRAVELDPESALANSLLGSVLYARLDWIGGHEAHMKAIAFLSDATSLGQHALLLMRSGRSAAARTQFDAAEVAEPLAGRPGVFHAVVSLAQSRYSEAKEIAESLEGAERLQVSLAIALNEGDTDAIKLAISGLLSSSIFASSLYAPVLRDFDSPERVLSTLRAVYADESTQWPSKHHDIAMLAAYFGDPELALRLKADEVRNTPVRLYALWYPLMSEVRRLPDFKDLVSDINLTAYWRAYGWADACRPLEANDFECG